MTARASITESAPAPPDWPPCGMTVAEWTAAIEDSTAAGLSWLPADALERLARQFSPAYIRQRRLQERDELLRELAGYYIGRAASGRQLAETIASHLLRYRSAGRPAGPTPADPQRVLLHRILMLSGGRPLAWRRIFGVLAGVQHSPRSIAHGGASNDGEGPASRAE